MLLLEKIEVYFLLSGPCININQNGVNVFRFIKLNMVILDVIRWMSAVESNASHASQVLSARTPSPKEKYIDVCMHVYHYADVYTVAMVAGMYV